MVKRIGKESRAKQAEDAETLLDAWLSVSAVIQNKRLVTELPYNESMICKLLIDDQRNGGNGLTATALCRATQMKKSQMNRTLTSMEARNLITRRPSENDHRSQLITIDTSNMLQFQKQHDDIIGFVSRIMNKLGPQQSREVTQALQQLASCVRNLNTKEA